MRKHVLNFHIGKYESSELNTHWTQLCSYYNEKNDLPMLDTLTFTFRSIYLWSDHFVDSFLFAEVWSKNDGWMSEENVKTKTALREQNQISLVVQVTHHTSHTFNVLYYCCCVQSFSLPFHIFVFSATKCSRCYCRHCHRRSGLTMFTY